MILPDVPCGHFALGTLSETYSKVNFLTWVLDRKNWQNLAKSKNVKFDMKIRNRIMTRYCFVSMKTSQRVMIYMSLEFVYFSTKTHICPKRLPRNTFNVIQHTRNTNLLYTDSVGMMCKVFTWACVHWTASRPQFYDLDDNCLNSFLGERYRNPILAIWYVKLYQFYANVYYQI